MDNLIKANSTIQNTVVHSDVSLSPTWGQIKIGFMKLEEATQYENIA